MICFSHLCISDAPDGGIGVFSISGHYLGNVVWAAQPTSTATATPEPSPAATGTPLASCRQECENGGGEPASTGVGCECARLTPAGMRTWQITLPGTDTLKLAQCAHFTAHKPNVSYKDLRMSVNGAVLPKCP